MRVIQVKNCRQRYCEDDGKVWCETRGIEFDMPERQHQKIGFEALEDSADCRLERDFSAPNTRISSRIDHANRMEIDRSKI